MLSSVVLHIGKPFVPVNHTCDFLADCGASRALRRPVCTVRGALLVTVEGVDTCACCAPHVRRTGEIGLIRILDAQKTGSGMRIFILCGERALEDLQKKSAVLREISRLTSKKQEEADEGVRHLLEENAALKAQAAEIQAELVALKAERVPKELRRQYRASAAVLTGLNLFLGLFSWVTADLIRQGLSMFG